MKYLQKLFGARSENQGSNSSIGEPHHRHNHNQQQHRQQHRHHQHHQNNPTGDTSASKLYSVTFVANPITSSSANSVAAIDTATNNLTSLPLSRTTTATETTKSTTSSNTSSNYQIENDSSVSLFYASSVDATNSSLSSSDSIDLSQVSISFQASSTNNNQDSSTKTSTSTDRSNYHTSSTSTSSTSSYFSQRIRKKFERQSSSALLYKESLVNNKLIANISTLEEDDWIIIDNSVCNREEEEAEAEAEKLKQKPSKLESTFSKFTMALERKDIQLIEASWAPAKNDTSSAGILLFKSLFTKFPQYLKFFPQFSDLDLENMRGNKRLMRHAIKVIDTVSFVVEAIADEKLTDQLNGALLRLVTSHLNRRIGLNEFRNLGVVLIDFICEINHKAQDTSSSSSVAAAASNDTYRSSGNQRQILEHSSSTGGSTSNEDNSETMTSALDKLGNSSTTSSSLSSAELGVDDGNTFENHNINNMTREQHPDHQDDVTIAPISTPTKIDTSQLVAAWTKLYSSILSLVEQEEAKQEQG